MGPMCLRGTGLTPGQGSPGCLGHPPSPPRPPSEVGYSCPRQNGSALPPAPRQEALGTVRLSHKTHGSCCHHCCKPGATSVREARRNTSQGCWDAEMSRYPRLSGVLVVMWWDVLSQGVSQARAAPWEQFRGMIPHTLSWKSETE